MYEEFYATKNLKVLDNSAANTLNNEDTLSSSSVIDEEHESPQVVSSSEEPIVNEPTTLVSDNNADELVQEDLVLWIINSGCSKHMTRNLKLLRNFLEKFIGVVRFDNHHFPTITGYGDYVQDLYNLFGPMYEEFYATKNLKVLDNSAANTLNNEDTLSSSSVIVEEHESPQVVSSSEEPIVNEPTTLVSDNNADELVQEDVAELDENFNTHKI
uniref:Integrase, catalytic region, zinc finger, CCHC-type, peptidase aspartic, catalytic n=1 Tax=Tanacetum cinerariifolium TaxID=118510 RepID=A0A6L2LS68_TANCI|nr:integrase, catalytic region, zinc finger, CCHC-type, peptidase aspartic, catalytic [Tanacetum cinerariifolium]